MTDSYDIEYIQLHVRKSNRAAFTLYSEKLGFEIHKKEVRYCELLTLSLPAIFDYGIR